MAPSSFLFFSYLTFFLFFKYLSLSRAVIFWKFSTVQLNLLVTDTVYSLPPFQGGGYVNVFNSLKTIAVGGLAPTAPPLCPCQYCLVGSPPVLIIQNKKTVRFVILGRQGRIIGIIWIMSLEGGGGGENSF